MIIYIAADHRGYKLKEQIKDFLKSLGYSVGDAGNNHYDENDDYPDFAATLADRVGIDHDNAKGILICGSGNGMAIVANKFMNVRAVVAMNSDQAFDSRNDEDANVLCLAADYTEPEQAKKIVLTWIQTVFSGEERFRRRINKTMEVEFKTCRPPEQRESRF